MPHKDADLLAAAHAVSAKWSVSPEITLVWMSAADFATMVSNYDAALYGRLSAGSVRPSQTGALQRLDKQINEAVRIVKTYINGKYETLRNPPVYALFGLVKEERTYRLPKDRQARLGALPLMITAIAAEGFGDKSRGTAFWTDMQDRYAAALEMAEKTDSSISGSASAKNVQKAKILKVMKALQSVLKGNYPDTYRLMWRAWGWQKENY